MEQNLMALRQAAVIYPIIAVLFTLPYIAYNYHKYGSVFSLRIVIVYSFMLYMLCVYCLIILPLPTGEAVAKLHGHKMQLVPFKFVRDILNNSGFVLTKPSTWLSLVNHPAFMTTVLNVLMTMPFGVYLRYYFRCDWKRTLALSFSLSLFFELTQLSGLYFIYPGSYRLFDVDDLMTNTLGGMLGYLIARPLTCWLPDRDALDSASFARGQHVSLMRRLLALFYDLAAAALFSAILSIFVPFRRAAWGMLAYFCFCPALLKGRSIGFRWTRIQLQTMEGGTPRWHQCAIRYLSLFAVLIWLPFQLNLLIAQLHELLTPVASLICFGILDGGYLFCLLFEAIRLGMHKPLFYEKLSGTQLVSSVHAPE
ncbi:MAG: VanZ family protein [Clostridia bacterium]|nr:VanZ family protein [Clostridia bacterium]